MAKTITAKQKKIILMVVGAVTVLYIDFVCILKPQARNLGKSSYELRQVRVSLKQYKNGSSGIRALEDSLDSMKARYANSENKIFSESEVTALLDDISKKALASGLKIMQMRPQGVSADWEKEIINSAGLRLLPLSLRLELSSAYHQLGRFISALENNPLISVTELRLRPESAEFSKQKVELTLKIYASKK
jgi:Tfp pilus assembly protein PilO